MATARDILFLLERNLEQYKDVGNVLKKINIAKYESFLQYFNIAKNTLKKPVVLAWYLKCSVLSELFDLISQNTIDGGNKTLALKYIRRVLGEDFSENDITESLLEEYDISVILSKLRHYLSFDLREIEGYQYLSKRPSTVFSEMELIVKSKTSSSKFFFDESVERKYYGRSFEDFIVFEDGWKWVLKNTSYCKFESKYGGEGHCGRCSSEKERIFSLREPDPVRKGYYKIWATFSIDDEGFLVQRKGVEEVYGPDGEVMRRYGNKKVDERVYDYVFRLLDEGNDRGVIKGLTSGSDYAQENDFKLSDFGDDRGDILSRKLEEKEYYESVFDEYEALGMTENILDKINNESSVFTFEPDEQTGMYHFTDLDLSDYDLSRIISDILSHIDYDEYAENPIYDLVFEDNGYNKDPESVENLIDDYDDYMQFAQEYTDVFDLDFFPLLPDVFEWVIKHAGKDSIKYNDLSSLFREDKDRFKKFFKTIYSVDRYYIISLVYKALGSMSSRLSTKKKNGVIKCYLSDDAVMDCYLSEVYGDASPYLESDYAGILIGLDNDTGVSKKNMLSYFNQNTINKVVLSGILFDDGKGIIEELGNILSYDL